jgi:hypothetical protein
MLPNGYFPPGSRQLIFRTDYQIQFNAIGNISSDGILAQSGQFTIVNGGSSATVSVSAVSETSTTQTSTGTATGSETSGTYTIPTSLNFN